MTEGCQHVLGVIVANSTVPRVPGEIGDPDSMPDRTLFETLCFQDFLTEMRSGVSRISLDRLLRCRDSLVTRGATCIATSCGLLWPYQEILQNGCPVPFVSSSLCLLDRFATSSLEKLCIVTAELGFLPMWKRVLGNRLKGARFTELGQDHYFYQALTGQIANNSFSLANAGNAIMKSIDSWLVSHPETEAILLECTNLSPYKQRIESETGLAVYDVFSAIQYAVASGQAVSS